MAARHGTLRVCPSCGGAILRGVNGGFFCSVCGFEKQVIESTFSPKTVGEINDSYSFGKPETFYSNKNKSKKV